MNELNVFTQYINNINPRMKFTVEVQNINKSINFLDLTITLNQNKHSFDIFHKKTETGVVIDKYSNHPFQQKTASFRAYLERLHRIPLSKPAYDKELKYIHQIAVNHNFNTNLIDKMSAKIKTKVNNQLAYTSNNNNNENNNKNGLN